VNSIIAPALVGKVCKIGLEYCLKHVNGGKLISFIIIIIIIICFLSLQDPTKQAEIDNYMVQQLDGTVNEWGWCKQKVSLHDFI